MLWRYPPYNTFKTALTFMDHPHPSPLGGTRSCAAGGQLVPWAMSSGRFGSLRKLNAPTETSGKRKMLEDVGRSIRMPNFSKGVSRLNSYQLPRRPRRLVEWQLTTVVSGGFPWSFSPSQVEEIYPVKSLAFSFSQTNNSPRCRRLLAVLAACDILWSQLLGGGSCWEMTLIASWRWWEPIWGEAGSFNTFFWFSISKNGMISCDTSLWDRLKSLTRLN
jgi:hypothetical protein